MRILPKCRQMHCSVTTFFYYFRLNILLFGCVFTRIQARADELGWFCAPFGRRLLTPRVQCSQDLLLANAQFALFFLLDLVVG